MVIWAAVRLGALAGVLLWLAAAWLRGARAYRAYYLYLKRAHHDTWLELMNRDSAITSYGEWIRWPFGSTALMRSSVSRETVDGDDTLIALRSTVRRAARHIALASAALLVLAALVPRT